MAKSASADLVAGVRRLLRAVDGEFIPPLSSRADSLSLATGSGAGTVEPYLTAIRDEQWLLVRRGGVVIGLLSYLVDHRDGALSPWAPLVYVTTVAVDAEHRRAGHAQSMYEHLARRVRGSGGTRLATRTWSSNRSHLTLLRRLGFNEVRRLVDDRSAGQDTIYLVLPTTRSFA